MYRTATLPERIRLLSQSGHGSVTYLTSDTPAAYAVEPEPYRVALRKCCGIAALGDSPLGLEDSCPHCDLSPSATDEALERHIVRCPRAGAWHKVHVRIATTMVSIMQEAGAPRDSVLTEVRGLRSADATRPGDVVQLDYMGPGVHLVLDAAVTCVFRNSIAAQVAVQPGYAARLREQTKFRVDACSSQPVARRHRFVPCVVEEGGRLGEHLLALLKELAERGIASGHLKQPPSWQDTAYMVDMHRHVFNAKLQEYMGSKAKNMTLLFESEYAQALECLRIFDTLEVGSEVSRCRHPAAAAARRRRGAAAAAVRHSPLLHVAHGRSRLAMLG
eukprot:jgi/Tetstr1/462386/TSEL_007392.t1